MCKSSKVLASIQYHTLTSENGATNYSLQIKLGQ